MSADAEIVDPQVWNDAMSLAARMLRAAGRPQSATDLMRFVRPIYLQDNGTAFDLVRPQYRAATPRLSINYNVASDIIRAKPALADIVGILSLRTIGILAGKVRNGRLRYDGYDLEFMQLRPNHLVVETAAFPGCFGWEHALTLSDPSATVELAAMVRKARSVGINCVLLHNSADHRFPLVSRITGLFHHVLTNVEDVMMVLDQAADAA